MLMALNVILAAFNMLPVPPLDGSRIADFFMPRKLRPQWEAFLQTGPVALAAVIVLPMIMGINLFYWPLHAAQMALIAVIRLLGAVV
jgi:Zn-dependent protease